MIFLGTYEHLRQGPFLELPHQTTLSKYTSFTDIGTGFNPDILNRFAEEIKIDTLRDHETNVSLLFDEMHIKAGLVFSRSSGKLIGFTELGDMNKELDDFKRGVEGVRKERDLATHVLTFMARGLFKHFNFPIGYFASVGFNSDQLFPCVWEAVRVLECMGIKVRAFVCDGASPNRRFFRMHQLPDKSNVSEDGVVFWAWNRFAKGRKIFFICDTPHLIKTTRNNMENSHGNRNTRQLMVSMSHLFICIE